MIAATWSGGGLLRGVRAVGRAGGDVADALVQAGPAHPGRGLRRWTLSWLGRGRRHALYDALGHPVQQRQRTGDDAAGPVDVLQPGLDDLRVALDGAHEAGALL